MNRLLTICAVVFAIACGAFAFGQAAIAIEGGVRPQECALPSTLIAHPDWYRDGLYCGKPYPNGYQPHSDQPPVPPSSFVEP